MMQRTSNKITVIISSLLVFFIVSACTEQGGKHALSELPDSVYVVKPRLFAQKRLKLSEIADTLIYIPLETNDKCLIGTVSRVDFFEDKILVHDRYNEKGLYLFNIKGGFLTKIGELGKGPGEYITPEYYHIDLENRWIEVLDRFTKKMIFFNFEGQLLKEQKLSGFFWAFYKWQDGYVFYLNNEQRPDFDYNIYFTDKNFNIIAKDLLIDEDVSGIKHLMYRNFHAPNDKLCFSENYNNKIYTVESHAMKPVIHFDFGDKWKPNGILSKVAFNGRERMKILNEAKYVFSLTNFLFVNSKSFYYSFRYNGVLIHNFHTDGGDIAYSHLENDLMDGPMITEYQPWIIHDGHIVYSQPAHVLKHMNENDNYPSKILKSVKTSDNPVIVCVRLRSDVF